MSTSLLCQRRGCRRRASFTVQIIIPDRNGRLSPRVVGLPGVRACAKHVHDLTPEILLRPPLRAAVEAHADGAVPAFEWAKVRRIKLGSREHRALEKGRAAARSASKAPKAPDIEPAVDAAARDLLARRGVIVAKRPSAAGPEPTADPTGGFIDV